MLPDAPAYTGIGTNYNFQGAERAISTMTTTYASSIVAFLTLFLGIVAGQVWNIISYTAFQLRSTLLLRISQHRKQKLCPIDSKNVP